MTDDDLLDPPIDTGAISTSEPNASSDDMALIFLGSSRCALCERAIEAEDGLVATSAFLGPEHRLWRYSDAAMHRECFLAWGDRQAFVEAYNSIVGPHVAGDGTRHQMLDDGSIRVHVVDPARRVLVEQQLAREAAESAANAAAQSRLDAQWRGRPRDCPMCRHRFVSVQDKGCCPVCRHVFQASDHETG